MSIERIIQNLYDEAWALEKAGESEEAQRMRESAWDLSQELE